MESNEPTAIVDEPEYIVVSESLTGEPIELPASPDDNSLGLATLTHAFPGAHGLKYKNPANGATRALLTDPSGTKFFAPTGGWAGKQFFVIYQNEPAKRSLLEAVPCKKAKIVEKKESNAKDLQWFQSLQQYVLYYEDEKKTKHCITPIAKQIAVTYAHSSHEKLTKEYTEKKPIIVRCYYNEEYRVEAKVVKSDKALDVVILQAVSENFFENNPPTDVPEIGTRYLMLGLSNIENQNKPFSLGCGNVMAILNDKARYVGSSGSSKGDSGAGIWNSSSALIGMNIMVKHNHLQVKQTSDNRQKQYTHATGGACVFVPIGTILLFASEYIPDEPPIPFEE